MFNSRLEDRSRSAKAIGTCIRASDRLDVKVVMSTTVGGVQAARSELPFSLVLHNIDIVRVEIQGSWSSRM